MADTTVLRLTCGAKRRQIHPVDVPFKDAVAVISKWGSGASALLAAMKHRGEQAASVA